MGDGNGHLQKTFYHICHMKCFNAHLHCLKMQTFVLQDGDSPLLASSLNGRLDVMKTLIEAGANIHQAGKVYTNLHVCDIIACDQCISVCM